MNTFQFHSPPQSKQMRFILGQFCPVLSHRHILWQFPSYHFAALAQHTWNHRMSSWRVHHPRTSKNLISGVLGSCLPTSAWKSPSTDTKPGWGVRACSVPREKSNVLQFLVVTRNNTHFPPLCSVISLQLRLLKMLLWIQAKTYSVIDTETDYFMSQFCRLIHISEKTVLIEGRSDF